MNILKINWREDLISLFPDVTERVKRDNDEWCPVCKGIGLKRENNYIVGCTNCYGKGIIEACECGNKIDRRGYTTCKDCRDKKEQERIKERFEKAKKIKYEDYDGKFLWSDRVVDKEELEDELYTQLYDGEDVPGYIYATKIIKVFSHINLTEIIYDKCEDGYEDMYSYFNYNDEDLDKAQDYLNKWIKKHENVLDCYYEDFSTIVLLDDVIKKLKEELKSQLIKEKRLLQN